MPLWAWMALIAVALWGVSYGWYFGVHGILLRRLRKLVRPAPPRK